jgi:MFS family permease
MLPETAGDALAASARRRWLVAGFPALRHRNFRLFVVGQGISLIGFWMQSVAQGWLVYRLSGSTLALGVVAFAGYLPILCLAPLAGVIADLLPRHRVLLVTQSCLTLLALALGALVATGAVTVKLVVLFAGAVGLISALDVPARQSFLVEMVGAGDLPNAIALNSSIFNGARVVGPALAGGVVGAVGEAPCFFLNAATYFAVLLALVRMRLPRAEATRRPAPQLGADFRSGLRYVWGRPVLRNLLLLLGAVCGLGVQYNMLMPAFAKTVFGAGAESYGLLLTAQGLGSVASSLQLATRRYSRLQHRRNLLLGLATFALAVLGLASSRSLPVALVCQTFAGYGMVRYLATTNTLLQLFVDEAYRGRMMGLHTVMFLGTQPLGGLVLGGLAQRFGAPAAALLSGGVSLAAAGWLAFRLRRLARRERAAGVPAP